MSRRNPTRSPRPRPRSSGARRPGTRPSGAPASGFRTAGGLRASFWRPGSGPEAERGSATAEFAVVLPCITVLLAVVVGAGACGAAAVRTEEAARLGARAAARGESEAEIRSVVLGVAGPESHTVLHLDGGSARVEVTAPAPGIIGEWSGLELSSAAVASTESADPEAGPEVGPQGQGPARNPVGSAAGSGSRESGTRAEEGKR